MTSKDRSSNFNIDSSTSTDDTCSDANGSSESSAGVVRGIARSFQQVSKRILVGRLPKKVPPVVSRAPPIARPPKLSVPSKWGRISVKRVADISDRVSNVFDVFDAVPTGNDSPSRTSTKDTESHHVNQSHSKEKVDAVGKGHVRRCRTLFEAAMLRKWASFGGNLIKNTLLGTIVFEVYGNTVYYQAALIMQGGGSDTTLPQRYGNNLRSQYAVVSTSGHFLSGGAGGFAHSLMTNIFNIFSLRSLPGSGYFGYHILHHSLAHSILFGSYELTKRSLLKFSSKSLTHERPYAASEMDAFTFSLAEPENLSIVTFSGGIAGVFQNILSQVAEGLEVDRKCSTSFLTLLRDIKVQVRGCRLSLPTLQSHGVAFVGTAIAFVAFEYGMDLELV